MLKEDKKLNPYSKRNLIQARVDNDELQEILTKARVYCDGDVSKFIRIACKNFKPLQRKVKNAD